MSVLKLWIQQTFNVFNRSYFYSEAVEKGLLVKETLLVEESLVENIGNIAEMSSLSVSSISPSDSRN